MQLTEVYFDDLQVTVNQTNIIQATNYYPFGGQQASSCLPVQNEVPAGTRSIGIGNKHLFNAGSELNQRTQNYETFYRNYDPVLGRFNGVDIMATSYTGLTPYQFAGNNPINANDPMGDQFKYMSEDQNAAINSWLHGDLDRVMDGLNSVGSGPISAARGNHWSNEYKGFASNTALMGREAAYQFYGHNMTDDQRYRAAMSLGTAVYENGSFTGTVYNPWYRGDTGPTTGGYMDINSYEGAAFVYNQSHKLTLDDFNQNGGDFDFLGYTANQVAVQGLYLGGLQVGSDIWYKGRADKIINAKFLGTAATARAAGNASDKAWLFATKLGSGDDMVKLMKFGKVAGPAATIAGMGISSYKLATGQGNGWDVADLTVNGIGLGVTALGSFAATAAIVSNPVGWIIGGVVLAYNGYRIYQSFTEE